MIVVRRMQQEDVEGVMLIENIVCEFPWTPSIFSDCIKVGYGCWVLSEKNKVLGYGLLSVSAGEGHILNLCISPERQRQGLGKRMMLHLIKECQRQRCDSVYLEVRVSNARAFELYKQLGFVQISERKDYYPATNGREDALVLSLSFNKENKETASIIV